jgi:hypothetical protein
MWVCGFVVMGIGGIVEVDLEVVRDDSAFGRKRGNKKCSSRWEDRVV